MSAHLLSERMSTRGFAQLTHEDRRRVASSGGKRAHELKRAHRWSSAEAREAQRRGAQTKRARKEVADE